MSERDDGRAAEAATVRRANPAEAATVRRANPDDARSIAEVTVASWQAAYRGILPDEFLVSLRIEPRRIAWHELLTRDSGGDTPVWVAEHAGLIRGFVSCGPVRDDDVPGPASEVYALYVEPSFWRRGLGHRLLDAATEHCRIKTDGALTLWVLEANLRARRFYEAMGWEADGASRSFELGESSAVEVRYRRGPD